VKRNPTAAVLILSACSTLTQTAEETIFQILFSWENGAIINLTRSDKHIKFPISSSG